MTESGPEPETWDAGGRPPLLSIVVVVFRDAAELKCILDNLSSFRSPEVEVIVIDGGSDDGTPELLRDNTSRIDAWRSEPDKGIYDAMNKGLRLARGTYVLHVNAGDRLLMAPLGALGLCAERNVDVVCCRVLEDGHHLFFPRNDWLLRMDNTWHHQGTFYLRRSHLGYDSSYKVFADFEHNQRLRRAGASVVILPDLVASHKTNGASSGQHARGEIFRSIRKNFGVAYIFPSFMRFQLLKLRSRFRGRFA